MITLATTSLAGILTIWLVYPAVVALLAKLKGTEALSSLRSFPTVAVIVATREVPALVRDRLSDLFESDYPAEQLSVVVGVDHASTAPLDAYAFADPRVQVVQGAAYGGKAANLNSAVAASQAEMLVFTDTGQRFDRAAIRHLVAAVSAGPYGVVSGALDTTARTRGLGMVDYYWLMERTLRENEARLHSTVGVTGAIYAMRRDLWRPLPQGLILDDLFVPMSVVLAGVRVGFCRNAIATDTRTFSIDQEYRRKVRTLTGVYQLCVLLPAVLSPVRNPIWLQFLFHKLLRFATPALFVVFAVSAGWIAIQFAASRLAIASSVAAGAAAGIVLVALAVPRIRRILRAAVAMQLALLEATGNALRRRWNVWTT